MKLRIHLASLLLLFISYNALAQNAVLRGTLQENATKAPIAGAVVSLKGTALNAVTGPDGKFEISNIPFGNYFIDISAEGYVTGAGSFPVTINSENADAGVLSVLQSTNLNVNPEENLPSVTLSDSDLKEESGQNVSGILSASRDPFVSAATFNFSIARFRPRGYSNEEVTYVNGIPMEDLTSGRTTYGTWGGLNDVMRSRENTAGLSASAYTYGSLAGSTNIDCKAASQFKQFQISYSISDRSYDNRIMATYGSGLMKGGWAISGSFSRRWAKEGYVKGTYYDGWSWFMSIQKQLGLRHNISLTHMGANTNNGRANAATAEGYDLAGSHYYNSYWGYQNGVVRNSNVGHIQEPATILTHDWNLDEHTNIETSLSYQYGISSRTALDWYNAPDPRPDYYRYMPSYTGLTDSAAASQVEDLWRNNEYIRQIKWDSLYNTNYHNVETIHNVDGIAGNDVTGLRSLYIVENRITENKRITFNTVMNSTVSDHFLLTKGFSFQHQESEYYKRVDDLLGGDFYVDLNQYADQDYPGDPNALQNDLLHPNRILHVGDKFGYDYTAVVQKSMFWMQGQMKFNHFDFFVGGNISNTLFYRNGLTQNGIFADNSLGKSAKQAFNNFGVKGGITYKLNGRNYFFFNSAYETRAPLFENAFVSPRTRNTVVTGLDNEDNTSMELGYLLRSPKAKVRVTGFYSQLNNATNTLNYYNDDLHTFVNYTLTNIDERHVGIEFGTDVALGHGLSANAAASVGQYYYNSRQLATTTIDNTDEVNLENTVVYSNNFYVDGGPQTAGSVGLNYRDKKFWYLSITANYFADIYTGFSPARRTSAAVALLDENDPNRADILRQEKLGSQFTLDISGGKSWKLDGKIKSLKRRTFLLLNAGIGNILDNKDFRTGGFEQLRYDFEDKNPDKFPSKYFYAFGRTYYASLILRFN